MTVLSSPILFLILNAWWVRQHSWSSADMHCQCPITRRVIGKRSASIHQHSALIIPIMNRPVDETDGILSATNQQTLSNDLFDRDSHEPFPGGCPFHWLRERIPSRPFYCQHVTIGAITPNRFALITLFPVARLALESFHPPTQPTRHRHSSPVSPFCPDRWKFI